VGSGTPLSPSHRRSSSRGRKKGKKGIFGQRRGTSSLDLKHKLDIQNPDADMVRKGWLGLFVVRSNIAQYQAGRLEAKELIDRNREALKHLSLLMASLRSHSCQLTAAEATYDAILSQADTDLNTSDITDSEALSERLRRSIYVLQIDDLLIFYCPRSGSTHVQRFGGRHDSVYRRSNDYEHSRREGMAFKQPEGMQGPLEACVEESTPVAGVSTDGDSDRGKSDSLPPFVPVNDHHSVLDAKDMSLLMELVMAQAEDQVVGEPEARATAFSRLRDQVFSPVSQFFEEVLTKAKDPSPQLTPKKMGTSAPTSPSFDIKDIDKDLHDQAIAKLEEKLQHRAQEQRLPKNTSTLTPKPHQRSKPKSQTLPVRTMDRHSGVMNSRSHSDAPFLRSIQGNMVTTSWPGSGKKAGVMKRPSVPTMTLRVEKEPRDKNLRNLFGLLKDDGELCREELPTPISLVCSRSVRALPWELIVPPHASVVRSLCLLSQVQASDNSGGVRRRHMGAPLFYATAWNGSANMVRLSQWECNKTWATSALEELSPSGPAVPEVMVPEKEASLMEQYGYESIELSRGSSTSLTGSALSSQSLDPAQLKEMSLLRQQSLHWPSHCTLLPFGQASWGPFTKRQLSNQIKVIDASQVKDLSDITDPIESKQAETSCFPILIFSFSDLYHFSHVVLSIVASHPEISILFVPAAFTGTVMQELVDHIKRGLQKRLIDKSGTKLAENQQICSPFIFLSLIIREVQQSLHIPIVTFNM